VVRGGFIRKRLLNSHFTRGDLNGYGEYVENQRKMLTKNQANGLKQQVFSGRKKLSLVTAPILGQPPGLFCGI